MISSGVMTVFTEPHNYFEVKEGLEKRGFKPVSGEVAQVSETNIHIEGKAAESMARLINVLEDHGVLLFLAPIMPVPITGRETFYRRLLELSFLTTADSAFAIFCTLLCRIE